MEIFVEDLCESILYEKEIPAEEIRKSYLQLISTTEGSEMLKHHFIELLKSTRFPKIFEQALSFSIDDNEYRLENCQPFTIGKDKLCNLELSLPFISRLHILLIHVNGCLYVINPGNKNGLFYASPTLSVEVCEEENQSEELREISLLALKLEKNLSITLYLCNHLLTIRL